MSTETLTMFASKQKCIPKLQSGGQNPVQFHATSETGRQRIISSPTDSRSALNKIKEIEEQTGNGGECHSLTEATENPDYCSGLRGNNSNSV